MSAAAKLLGPPTEARENLSDQLEVLGLAAVRRAADGDVSRREIVRSLSEQR